MTNEQHVVERSDGELLSDHLKGAAGEPFARLVHRYVDLVYSVAQRQVRDRQLAEDVTQNVFLLLMRKAAQLSALGTIGGWLCQAALFDAKNVIKRRSREAKRIQKLGQLVGAEDGSMHADAWKQIGPHLDEALGSLSGDERDAIVMRYLQHEPYDRIAATLGINESAARQRVHRALDRLRQLLGARGVLASVAVVSSVMKANAVQAAPAGLASQVIAAAGKLSVTLAGSKGALTFVASLNAKLVVAILIVLSLAAIGAGAVVMARRHRAGQTVYLGPAPVRPAGLPAGNGAADGARTGRPVRPPFQLVSAARYEDHKGTKTVGGFIGHIEKGDWLRFDGVDLGAMGGGAVLSAVVSCPDQFAGNTIEARADRVDGPLLAKLQVRSTGGYGNWRAQSAPLTPGGGVHDVFLVFSGGGFNLDTFKIALASRSGTNPIAAISFNEAKGVRVRGDVVCETEEGHWAGYDGLDFGDAGVDAVVIDYSCENAHAGGRIELRLDGQEGRVLCELPVEGTGNWNRFVQRIVPFGAISGRHDVVMCFHGKGHGVVDVARLQFVRQRDRVSAPTTTPLLSATEPAGK